VLDQLVQDHAGLGNRLHGSHLPRSECSEPALRVEAGEVGTSVHTVPLVTTEGTLNMPRDR
jgi:hypothetical protein